MKFNVINQDKNIHRPGFKIIVFLMLAILLLGQSATLASADISYTNFKELSSIERLNLDYRIETSVTDSHVIVVAIHGGKIEKGTAELAYALAHHNKYNYYSFLGLKNRGNLRLHICSDKFDEPKALEMVSKAETILSIHGCFGSGEFTYIGGLDTELESKIKKSLLKYGFTVLDTPRHLAGFSPNNIVNRGIHGAGVQLEISNGLRTQFLAGNNDSLKNYVLAISEAVNSNE